MPPPIGSKSEPKRSESSPSSGFPIGTFFLVLSVLAGIAYFAKKFSKKKIPELPKPEPIPEPKPEPTPKPKQETLVDSEHDKIASKFGDFK